MRDERKNLTFFLSCVLVAATLLVYWQLGGHGFVIYDDPEYVYENPFVRMGLTSTSIEWAFTTFHSANWHPVTWLSHMTDVQLFRLDPWGHHLSSLILHASNALLLFLLLCRLTGFAWRSIVVAALFAIHPLHVESVAWVAERKDLLCAFFWFLTIYFYVCYLSWPKKGRYVLLLSVFTLGLMSKPMLVTMPFVLLLLDFWPLGRMKFGMAGSDPIGPVDSGGDGIRFRRLLVEKLPFLALSGISCSVTLLAQHNVGAVKSLTNYPFLSRLANALTVYADYLCKMVWPHNLAVFYPFPATIHWDHLMAASLLLIAVSSAVFFSRGKRPYLLFGWLWYLGTLVPVIGIVQVGGQASADRYTYIPLIGIFVALTWWLSDCTSGYRMRKIILTTITVAVLAACTVITVKQISYWQNDVTLFSHALAVTDENYVAHNNLGFALVQNGKYAEAGWHFSEAIRIAPSLADAWLNQGDNLLRAGEIEKSLPYFSRAIELRPNFPAAYNDLGVAMMRRGRLHEADENFTRAVALDPFMADGSFNKGMVTSMMGRPEEAISHFAKALQLNPDNPGYHVRIGVELINLKRFADARVYFSEALRLNPNDATARNYLDKLSRWQGGRWK